MPQEIIPGLTYRLNIWPNPEYRCPVCDTMIVPDAGLNGLVGRVEALSVGTLIYHNASDTGCMEMYPSREGCYSFEGFLAVPYTWLEGPIKEEE